MNDLRCHIGLLIGEQRHQPALVVIMQLERIAELRITQIGINQQDTLAQLREARGDTHRGDGFTFRRHRGGEHKHLGCALRSEEVHVCPNRRIGLVDMRRTLGNTVDHRTLGVTRDSPEQR